MKITLALLVCLVILVASTAAARKKVGEREARSPVNLGRPLNGSPVELENWKQSIIASMEKGIQEHMADADSKKKRRSARSVQDRPPKGTPEYEIWKERAKEFMERAIQKRLKEMRAAEDVN